MPGAVSVRFRDLYLEEIMDYCRYIRFGQCVAPRLKLYSGCGCDNCVFINIKSDTGVLFEPCYLRTVIAVFGNIADFCVDICDNGCLGV